MSQTDFNPFVTGSILGFFGFSVFVILLIYGLTRKGERSLPVVIQLALVILILSTILFAAPIASLVINFIVTGKTISNPGDGYIYLPFMISWVGGGLYSLFLLIIVKIFRNFQAWRELMVVKLAKFIGTLSILIHVAIVIIVLIQGGTI
jgi:hypothetical protein